MLNTIDIYKICALLCSTSFTFLLPYLFELDSIYHVEGEAQYLIFLPIFLMGGEKGAFSLLQLIVHSSTMR
jgi:hypothetical protein